MKKIFIRLLEYLDEKFWDYKQTNTNFRYLGLTLDYYFENSVLSIDYLNIEDYFIQYGITYNEHTPLSEQIESLPEENWLMLIQCVLNILKVTQINKPESEEVLGKSLKYLERHGVRAVSTDIIELSLDSTIGEGAYCVVSKYAEGIVKKELLSKHKNDEKLRTRLKYEYENTNKLGDCPNIITVYEFDENENSYLLQQAEMDLYDYLKSEVSLSRKKDLK